MMDEPPGFDDEPEVQASSSVPNRLDGVAGSSGQALKDESDTIRTQASDNSMYTSATTFEELGLSPSLLKGLYDEMKFEKPSRIQATTLPMILSPPYKHLVAQAHNGSGKTTCFVLSMLSRSGLRWHPALCRDVSGRGLCRFGTGPTQDQLCRVDPDVQQPQALCLCPTRELVVQNLMVVEKMGKYTGIKAASTASLDAGSGRPLRIPKLTQQVVIGTHGRMKSWVTSRVLTLDRVEILVFDEADEMLKMDGFADDSLRLMASVRKVAPNVQILLFSATYNEPVKQFCLKIVPNANQVFVPKEELSLDVIKQYKVAVPTKEAKLDVLRNFVFPNADKLGQTIIFVRTREMARKLHEVLNSEGFKCTSLDGKMEPADRDRVVTEFREARTKILISTDVLSRGFDVTQVTLVINYDLPTTREGAPAYETYMHRIGRSGRFGRKGAAFNFCCDQADHRVLNAIIQYFNHDIPEMDCSDEDHFIAVLREAGLCD